MARSSVKTRKAVACVRAGFSSQTVGARNDAAAERALTPVRPRELSHMLRFKQQDDFEAWLAACPLDPNSLDYSVTRGGDGLLSVVCKWQQAPLINPQRPRASGASQSPAPPDTTAADAAAEAETKAAEEAAAEAARAAEADRLRGMINSMQSMIAASPQASAAAGDASLAAAINSALTGGGGAAVLGALSQAAGGRLPQTPSSSSQAALAAAMLERRSRDPDGLATRPSREEIRAMISLASGAPPNAFPPPPGHQQQQAAADGREAEPGAS